MVELFPGTASPPGQSNKSKQVKRSVTTTRPTNINVVPIDYACPPRLRGRLTLLRLTLSRNPWSFGERVSHPLYRYSCQHSRFRSLHRIPHRPASQSSTCICATASRLERGFPRRSAGGITNTVLLHGTLRYRAPLAECTLSFGSWLEPRYIFAARQLV